MGRFDLANGLWVPEHVASRRRVARASSPAQHDRREGGAGDELIRVPATLGNIGFGALDADELQSLITDVAFEPAMRLLSAVAAEIHHSREEPRRHLALAHALLGENPLTRMLGRWLAQDPGRLIFDVRHVAALQRLLVEHGSRETVEPDHRSYAKLITALLGVGDVLADPEPPEPDADGILDVDAWSAFMVATGAYYAEPYVLDALARAFAIFVEIAPSSALRDDPQFCDVEAWAADAGGLGLREQLCAGLAAAVSTRALDPDCGWDQRGVPIREGLFAHTHLAGLEVQVFAALSATRDEFRAAFATAGPPGWDHTPFEQHPFLRCEDGGLSLVSPTALVSWMTRGLHFRLLDAAGRPEPGIDSTKRARRYLGFAGRLHEEYTLRLVADSHSDQLEVMVSGEREYRIGKRRILSPDVAVAGTEDVVLMEVCASRMPRDARTFATPEAVGVALQKMVLDKLVELQKRTGDILAGHFAPPGASDGPSTLWPVLVLASEGVMITPLLFSWLADKMPAGAFGDPRTAAVTIVDLNDLEPLLAMVEEGHDLPRLLAEFHASPFAKLPLRNWLGAVHRRPADARPRFTAGAADRAADAIRDRLFHHVAIAKGD